MSAQPRIVLIGAGSMSFGVNMLRDVFGSRELHGSTLVLVDIDAEALARMDALARILNDKSGARVRIEATTDRRRAFAGAQFVVNATAIDRNRLWKLDFEIPKKYGVRHSLGENGGPGGLFFTLRTLPLVFDIVRDMEEICPEALLINFSNPESRIILALAKYSTIRAVGLCHGLFMSRYAISQMIGVDVERIDLWAAGLNHFQCVLAIRERETMEDLYPRLFAADKTHDPTFHPLTRDMLRAFGYWLTCSDDHLGEYLAYGWEAGEDGYDFAEDERYRGEMTALAQSVVAGGAIPPDWLQPSAERAALTISAVAHNRPTPIASIIHCNRGTIPNLPDEVAIETPAVIDGLGLHPISLGPLPDPIAKLMAMQASVQQLAVEAAVRASKEIALQALLIDPVVSSISGARAMLDELWEINEPYIRSCV